MAPTVVSATKFFSTSQVGLRSAGRSKFDKKLGLIFEHPYWLNSTQICLGTTLKLTEDQHSIKWGCYNILLQNISF